MDHESTREQLELAAVEPGGLERLMAGDTAAAQSVAAHLAGCPSCTDELTRLERASTAIRQTVRALPPPDLRSRTLARIRVEGIARPLASGAPISAAVPLPAVTPPADLSAPVAVRPRGPSRYIGQVATIAAAVFLSVATTWLVVGAGADDRLADQAQTISALERVTSETAALATQPDAARVRLTGVTDKAVDGYLAFSPSTTELVVVVNGLTPPPEGQEYRCWVEVDGSRQRVGRMFFSPDLSFWVGPAPAVAGLSSGATFGVSLVDAAGGSVDGPPVILGGT